MVYVVVLPGVSAPLHGPGRCDIMSIFLLIPGKPGIYQNFILGIFSQEMGYGGLALG